MLVEADRPGAVIGRLGDSLTQITITLLPCDRCRVTDFVRIWMSLSLLGPHIDPFGRLKINQEITLAIYKKNPSVFSVHWMTRYKICFLKFIVYFINTGHFKISIYLPRLCRIPPAAQQEGSSAQCVFLSMCSAVSHDMYSKSLHKVTFFSLFLTPNPTQGTSAVVWQLCMQKAKNVFIHMQQ